MNEANASRKIAALTAIIQTLILEQYWEEDEEAGKQRFLGMAEGDHPVAMAIMNELSEDELDAAFRWPDQTHMGAGKELPAMPVVAFLTQDQYERARVTCVANAEGDFARELAMQEPNPAGAMVPGASERVALAEERFVSGMFNDLVSRQGEGIGVGTKGSLDERIAAMPEPWKSRTRIELERSGRTSARCSPNPGRANPQPELVTESPHRADSGASFAGVVSRPRRYSGDELLYPSHGRR